MDARENFERVCIFTSQKTMMEKIQDIAALEAWGVEIFTGRLESERSFKRACEGMLHKERGNLDAGMWRQGKKRQATQVTEYACTQSLTDI